MRLPEGGNLKDVDSQLAVAIERAFSKLLRPSTIVGTNKLPQEVTKKGLLGWLPPVLATYLVGHLLSLCFYGATAPTDVAGGGSGLNRDAELFSTSSC